MNDGGDEEAEAAEEREEEEREARARGGEGEDGWVARCHMLACCFVLTTASVMMCSCWTYYGYVYVITLEKR